MTNWRPGSAGEREQKEARLIGLFTIVVSVVCLALIWVIPSMYQDAVQVTALGLNVLGSLLVAFSVVPVILSTKAGEEGVQGYIYWWAGSLALGLMIAACQGL